ETYRAEVPCGAGCRLVGVQIMGPETDSEDLEALNGYAAAPDGVGVELYRLGDVRLEPGSGPGDATRWRTGLGPRDLGPVISTGKEGLRMTVAQASRDIPLDRDDWGFVADTPAPLPVLTAGWRAATTAEARLAPLAGAAVPITVADRAPLVPRFGPFGAVVDLEYAERMVPFALAGGTPQVWLSADAPDTIVEDLEAAGLTVLHDEST